MEIVVVVRDGMQAAFEELAAHYGFRKPFRLVPGGKERQDSVWSGLQALAPESELVAIQDAARPCTPELLIAATIEAARETGAAVAAQAVTDTIKESVGGRLIERTLDRSHLWAVQAPQTFRVEVIRLALGEVRRPGSGGDRRYGGLRVDRATSSPGGKPAAHPQSDPPRRPPVRRDVTATGSLI